MASSGDMLLRMLEPTVRPGPTAGPRKAAATPIESRSFESLLEEAKTAEPAGAKAGAGSAEATSDGAKPAGPLDALGRVDRIQNASLRKIIGGAEPGPG